MQATSQKKLQVFVSEQAAINAKKLYCAYYNPEVVFTQYMGKQAIARCYSCCTGNVGQYTAKVNVHCSKMNPKSLMALQAMLPKPTPKAD